MDVAAALALIRPTTDFAYNAGTADARSQAFDAVVARKLAAMQPKWREAAQRAGLLAISTTAEIGRFLRDTAPGTIAVAKTPQDILERLNAVSAEVLLSRYTATKPAKHPEITAESCAMLPALLDTGERAYDKALHAVVISMGSPPHVAVLKATGDGRQVFLQSFRRTHEKNAQTLRQRRSDD